MTIEEAKESIGRTVQCSGHERRPSTGMVLYIHGNTVWVKVIEKRHCSKDHTVLLPYKPEELVPVEM